MGVTPKGKIFTIPENVTDYDSYDFTSKAPILAGGGQNAMDMYADVENNIAYIVTDIGLLKIIDMDLLEGQGDQVSITLESSTQLSAIERSTNVSDRFMIGQVTGTDSIKFISIQNIASKTDLGNIPINGATDLWVTLGGITSLDGQAAFFVVTTSDSGYFTQVESANYQTFTDSKVRLVKTFNTQVPLVYEDQPDTVDGTNYYVTSVLSEGTEAIFLAKEDSASDGDFIRIRFDYQMENCDETCQICLAPGPGRCSSCAQGYEKEENWVLNKETEGTCIPSVKLSCEGVLISHCTKCVVGEESCEECYPKYGLFEEVGTDGENRCKKCESGKVNSETNECQETAKIWSYMATMGLVILLWI